MHHIIYEVLVHWQIRTILHGAYPDLEEALSVARRITDQHGQDPDFAGTTVIEKSEREIDFQ